jgi:CRP-like cAMP-binding protein
MYPELLHHIGKYVTLSLEEQDIVCQHFELKQVKKKQHLLQEGQLCEGNYFVVKGCLRQYLINDKLNEQIIQFGLENWWIADQDSLLNQKPSQCYIQALEPAEVLLLPEKNRKILFEQVPQLETYFRIMMQIAFVAAQRRIGFIFNMSDEERYRHFMKLFPAFAQRIPQYMLASYLGFTPQFMSRLRAKKV